MIFHYEVKKEEKENEIEKHQSTVNTIFFQPFANKRYSAISVITFFL